MRAIVTIIDEKTGCIFQKDKLVEPYREQRDPQLCVTRYDFRFEFNVADLYFRDILNNLPVVEQPPFPYGFAEKEEKLQKLRAQLSIAGDRRDWDECERIEKEIEKLEGESNGIHEN